MTWRRLLLHLPAAAFLGLALGAGGVAAEPVPLSATAEGIYAAARPKLLQVRTLVEAAGRQSTIGSAFLVSGDGVAITNYHVVSQYALEPDDYRLEYATADGRHGALTLLAVDVANDLAAVRLDRGGEPFFAFDDRALKGTVPKGERLYSMGNPLDLGFTIVEGTYNGLVERSYAERIHFSGALNPGMSGGPTVAADGSVVGINVAKNLGGELVSFLVPARFAAALIAGAKDGAPPEPTAFVAEIGRQLKARQEKLYAALGDYGFRATGFGPYQAPEPAAPWFTCWARTNADQVPKARAAANTTNCGSDARLFIAGDLNTGQIQLSQSYLRGVDLNDFQFAAFLTRETQSAWLSPWSRKWQTPQRCREDFVADPGAQDRPLLRVVWCARAYRPFEGLYDVMVLSVTQDRAEEALASRLSLQSIAYDDAVALTRRFLEAVRWTK